MKRIDTINSVRRRLLIWGAPTIVAISIPAHAQTSPGPPPPPPEPTFCGSAPVMEATVASKCSGDPPVGQAVVTIFSDAADASDVQLEIRSVTINGAADTDSFMIPSLPANVIDTIGLEIEWSGNATDATTCLPTSAITIDVVYSCATGSEDQSISFNFTDVLSAVV